MNKPAFNEQKADEQKQKQQGNNEQVRKEHGCCKDHPHKQAQPAASAKNSACKGCCK